MSRFTKKEIHWIKTALMCVVVYKTTTFVIDHLPTNR